MAVLTLPPYGQHIVFLGSTGTGKSILAEQMLQRYSSYLAIDSQDSLDRLQGLKIKRPQHIDWVMTASKRIIYKPKPEYLFKEAFNYIFKSFLETSKKNKKKPRICYIDEIYHIGYGVNFPVYLPKGMTTARQRALSFWIATQRPKMIPVPVLTEASLIIVFMLSRYEDIKYISGFSRSNPKAFMEVLQAQQKDHSFIIINNHEGTWQKFPPIKRSGTK